jgi:hypothetical protein
LPADSYRVPEPITAVQVPDLAAALLAMGPPSHR